MTSENESGLTSGAHDPAELLASAPDARDITAEIAAPPRQKLPWPTLALAGAVIAVAAFAGGAWYQKGDGSSGGQQAAGGRQFPGGAGGYGFPGGGAGGYGGRAGGTGTTGGNAAGAQGGFTRGTVTSVDGATVYLTDASGNTVKVTTGDSTKVTLNKDGKVADLQPGQTVTVVGQRGDDGSYTATQLSEGAAGGFGGFGGARGTGTGTGTGTGSAGGGTGNG